MKFRFIFFAVCIFARVALAQDLNFKQIWSFPIDESPRVQISSGFGKVFIPLPNGVLKALDSRSGKIIWNIELGGEFTDTIKIVENQNAILVLTEKTSNAKRAITLRSINAETGIIRWQRSNDIFNDAPFVDILVSKDSNVVATSREVFASDNESGKVSFESRHRTDKFTELHLDGHFLFEIRNSNEIAILDIANNGLESTLYKGKTTIRGKLSIDSGRVYFSDLLGVVYSLDLLTKKVVWKTRLGAEVIDIESFFDSGSVLVVSKDIYFYQLSKKNGKKTKKIRLETSSFGDLAYLSNSRSVAVSFDEEILIIEAKTGNIGNKIVLKEQLFFPAIVEADVVIAVTSKGIVAYK